MGDCFVINYLRTRWTTFCNKRYFRIKKSEKHLLTYLLSYYFVLPSKVNYTTGGIPHQSTC
jgi:hypothetical protein